MIGLIKSGFNAVFGVGQKGSDNVMEVARGVGTWIDERNLTDEEIMKNNAEMIPHMNEFIKNTVAENTERSRTRREIAIWIIRNWFIMLWVSIFAYGLELAMDLTHDFSAFVFSVATFSAMTYLVLGVGGFFFGAHIVRQIKG